MDLGIRGKTALVTASSSGIGKQCALILAAEGARVVVCARGQERLLAAAKEIEAVSGPDGVLAVQADLSIAGDITGLCRAARSRFGAIDILVYITSAPKRGGFTSVSDSDLREAFEMTVLGAFRLLNEVLPAMRERKWGRVVTVQARSVREPIKDLITSVSTRPGVAGLFKYLSNEIARDGVLINTVVPGRIRTARYHQGVQSDEHLGQQVAEIPLGRLGEAEEVANAVCFLASERASYVNGATLQVDGGLIKAI